MITYGTRHERTFWNGQKRVQTWADVPETDILDAGYLAARLKSAVLAPEGIGRVITSGLRRSDNSGEAILMGLGLPGERHVLDTRLRDSVLGYFDGYTLEHLAQVRPGDMTGWRRAHDAGDPDYAVPVRPELLHPDLRAYGLTLPEPETLGAAVTRAKAAFDELHDGDLFVTHRDTLAHLAHAFGAGASMPFTAFAATLKNSTLFRFDTDAGAVAQYDWDRKAWIDARAA